jgi:hypothetical protein
MRIVISALLAFAVIFALVLLSPTFVGGYLARVQEGYRSYVSTEANKKLAAERAKEVALEAKEKAEYDKEQAEYEEWWKAKCVADKAAESSPTLTPQMKKYLAAGFTILKCPKFTPPE